MPILRTYQCEDCNHRIEVTLASDQWNDEAPECPACASRPMQQEFKPFAIGGTPTAKAHAIAEDIAANDYHVADMQRDKHADRPVVRYKDQTSTVPPSTWQAANQTLEMAIASGRQMRLKHGSGLDVLQANIASGAEPDLIANSKRRAMKVW